MKSHKILTPGTLEQNLGPVHVLSRAARRAGRFLVGTLWLAASMGLAPTLAQTVGVGDFASAGTLVVNGTKRASAMRGMTAFTFGNPDGVRLEKLLLTGASVPIPVSRLQTVPSGLVSLTLTSAVSFQVASDGRFQTAVRASLHFPLIDELRGYEAAGSGDAAADAFRSFEYAMSGTLRGRFRGPLPAQNAPDGTLPVELTLDLSTTSGALTISMGARVSTPVTLHVTRILGYACSHIEELCIQPVGVKSSDSDASPSGTAFDTLWPIAESMWARGCFEFEVKPFVYVVDADLKVLDMPDCDASKTDEDSRLLGSYDDPDCVEIFFIEQWDPEDCNGGGATYSIGTASAKVITADSNDNGIDLHHLAHEMGHVLDLMHPEDGCPTSGCPYSTSGSEGTVLCPSGYENDNPAVQSRDNLRWANNPLVHVSYGVPRIWTFDCTDSSDCGPCP